MPFEDERIDVVLSEYGASIWCDPYLWIPEAARVLRPGGTLIFLVNSVLVMLCAYDEPLPTAEKLLRPQFGMHRFEWPDDDSVEFHLPHGEMIKLLRANGMYVEQLIEVQAPADAKQHRFEALPSVEWARKWPSEEIWKARKQR
jgi:SAM-dependent methyltransferase